MRQEARNEVKDELTKREGWREVLRSGRLLMGRSQLKHREGDGVPQLN